MNSVMHFLSNNLDVLSVIGAVLGVLAASYSTLQTYRRKKAEEEFRRKLALERAYKKFLSQRNLLAHASENALTEDEVSYMMQFLVQAVRDLNQDDRERIEEALYQPSIRGRINYISKLLTESKEKSQNLEQLKT